MRLGKRELPTPALCGCVTGENPREMEEGVERAKELGADCVELRVDWLKEWEGWERLLSLDFPKILTNRPVREGGKFRGGEEERVGILLRGIELGVDCVDIEFSSAPELLQRVLEEARRRGTSTILSFHDFDGTPPLEVLKQRVEELSALNPDFVKLVTMARSKEECFRMFDLIRSVRGRPIIAFAMGEEGHASRIVAALLGSPIVYTSVGEQTAPGQLGLKEMRVILRR
ncbi:MAG: type I 3-dehydroquinate dehydratase [Candidatus Hadarchaeales archaeon]